MSRRNTISNSTRYDIFKRDNFTCRYCGKSAPNVELEIDHIRPVSKGGTNKKNNLATSCMKCNNGKSDKYIERNLDDIVSDMCNLFYNCLENNHINISRSFSSKLFKRLLVNFQIDSKYIFKIANLSRHTDDFYNRVTLLCLRSLEQRENKHER